MNSKTFSNSCLHDITARKAKHLDATTMFRYSYANTPLAQSERAYYLTCGSFINGYVGMCIATGRAMYGYVGLCMSMYGYVGLSRAMYGYVGLCMAM